MNQTRQKTKEASNSFKSPSCNSNHKESPNDSTSKRAHQVPMLRNKPEIKRLLREEEEE